MILLTIPDPQSIWFDILVHLRCPSLKIVLPVAEALEGQACVVPASVPHTKLASSPASYSCCRAPAQTNANLIKINSAHPKRGWFPGNCLVYTMGSQARQPFRWHFGCKLANRRATYGMLPRQDHLRKGATFGSSKSNMSHALRAQWNSQFQSLLLWI